MNKTKGIILSIAAIFLGVVLYQNYSLPLDANMITPDSFYRGSAQDSNMSPKEYYNRLHNLSFSDNSEEACNVTVKSGDGKGLQKITDNTYFFSLKKDDSQPKEGDLDGWASYIGAEGENLFDDKGEIYLPIAYTYGGKDTFANNNTLNSRYENTDKTNIEVYVGDRTVMVFEDVMNWWCHAHKPDITKHTSVVGNTESDSTVRREVPLGSLIGIANATTKVKTYYVPDDVYDNGNVGFSSIKSYDMLKQIDTGKYIAKREISFL